MAEARRKARPATSQPEADLRRLPHELEVHPIELEMRNEELRSGRGEIEAGLAPFTELFGFAPVGYFDLTVDGTIGLANRTGAGLRELSPTVCRADASGSS